MTSLPTIRLTPPSDPAPLARAATRLDRYDWIVVTSVNAVRRLARSAHRAASGEALRARPFAAVGPATEGALRALGVEAALVPPVYRGEALAEGIVRATEPSRISRARILLVQAEAARPVLWERLVAAGARVDVAPAYAVEVNRAVRDPLRDYIERGRGDWLTFTASSAVRAFVELVGPQTGGALIAAISPVTAGTLSELGLPVHVVARTHSMPGLVDALVRAAARPANLRPLVRETRRDASDLVYPMFIVSRGPYRQPIAAMPGIDRLSVEAAVEEAGAAYEEGVRAVLLFGLPASKDARGSRADQAGGVIQRALEALRDAVPDLVLITDVCLCEYTDHGHCGIVEDGRVVNDATLERLAAQAVSHGAAGADVVAPSDMMDGRVGVIRGALDEAGLEDVAILSYAAKYASAFYGPFREAADSAPAFGDRRGYQMDVGNADEAIREVRHDIAEGADIVMVKPALPSLDILRRVKEEFRVPTAAYQVSGEYAMIEAAGANGWLDAEAASLEAVTAIRRAGADLVVTYAARRLARTLA